ncbi:transposase (ISH6) [Halococcus salifodinae DSM 8989]|uniref:Transposase (ISH6) n=1 Tax=Halococcus salifodinae DSM 8989 TaxID=1227456 RepID=M0N8M5_9EURY|nr:transposase (ISH6) [Halococcus salifodinae DSM 8989]
MDVSVDNAWDDTATALDEIEAVTDDARVVSDAEEGLTEAFTTEDRLHQLDLVHVPRTTSYKLWEDGAFCLEERNQIVSEVSNDLFHLKNSVEKHRPNEEWAAIRERIATTKQRIRHLAWQLDQLSSPKTATYLRRWLPSMMLFAEEAVDGFEVPWTSNPVERAMGEVSKRCKNQWMRWSAAGLEALLQLRLVDYANPEQYQAFKHELLQRSTKTSISCDLSVEATRGEL